MGLDGRSLHVAAEGSIQNYIGIMEKKMETTIVEGLRFKV